MVPHEHMYSRTFIYVMYLLLTEDNHRSHEIHHLDQQQLVRRQLFGRRHASNTGSFYLLNSTTYTSTFTSLWYNRHQPCTVITKWLDRVSTNPLPQKTHAETLVVARKLHSHNPFFSLLFIRFFHDFAESVWRKGRW